jgi:hypothetical protein
MALQFGCSTLPEGHAALSVVAWKVSPRYPIAGGGNAAHRPAPGALALIGRAFPGLDCIRWAFALGGGGRPGLAVSEAAVFPCGGGLVEAATDPHLVSAIRTLG